LLENDEFEETYCALLFRQKRRNFVFEDVRVGRSDMLFNDAAVPVEQECDGQAKHAAIFFADLRVPHHNRIVHMELLGERADRFWAVVHRDTNNLKSALSVFILKFDKMRDLLSAREAPRRPEIKQHGLATIRREAEWLPIELRKGEVRRKGMLLGRCHTRSKAAIVLPYQQYEGKQERCSSGYRQFSI